MIYDTFRSEWTCPFVFFFFNFFPKTQNFWNLFLGLGNISFFFQSFIQDGRKIKRKNIFFVKLAQFSAIIFGNIQNGVNYSNIFFWSGVHPSFRHFICPAFDRIVYLLGTSFQKWVPYAFFLSIFSRLGTRKQNSFFFQDYEMFD